MRNIKLGEIAEIFTGTRVDRFKNIDNYKRPVFKNKLTEDNLNLEYEEKYIPFNIDGKFLSKKGDILISLSAPNNVILIDVEDYVIPMFFAVIRLKEGFDSKFIYNALKSSYFSKELNKVIEGTAIKILKVEYLKEIELNIPTFEDQIKYAELFDLINRRSLVLNKNLELNEEFKDKILYDLLND